MQVDPVSLQASLNMAEGASGRYTVKVAIQIEGGKNPIWDQSQTAGLLSEGPCPPTPIIL